MRDERTLTNAPENLRPPLPAPRVSDERLAKIIETWVIGNRDVYETACDLRDCRAALDAARRELTGAREALGGAIEMRTDQREGA